MIDNYDKLTLAKWAQLAALKDRDFADDVERQVAVLAILADKSERDLLALPLPEYATLAAAAEFLFAEPKPSKIAANGLRRLQLDGWTLIPTTDIRKVTTAQYVDFQTLITAGADIPQLLSCFLVPEGYKYCDGYDVGEVHALLARALTVPDALALKGFFLRKFSESTERFLTYCKIQIALTPRRIRKQAAAKLATTSSQSGTGSTPSVASATPRTKTGRRYTRSQSAKR